VKLYFLRGEGTRVMKYLYLQSRECIYWCATILFYGRRVSDIPAKKVSCKI